MGRYCKDIKDESLSPSAYNGSPVTIYRFLRDPTNKPSCPIVSVAFFRDHPSPLSDDNHERAKIIVIFTNSKIQTSRLHAFEDWKYLFQANSNKWTIQVLYTALLYIGIRSVTTRLRKSRHKCKLEGEEKHGTSLSASGCIGAGTYFFSCVLETLCSWLLIAGYCCLFLCVPSVSPP